MSGKVLIFQLSRYGYADYAAGMINHLQLENCLVYLSKYHSVPVNKPYQSITTYRNNLEFFLSSIFILPRFMCRVFHAIKNQKVTVAYFLGFHYWDLPLIWICNWRGIPVVYTVHDGILHDGEKYWSHAWLQNACIKFASELIFLTAFMKNITLQQLNIQKPSTVIPHGPITLPNLSTSHRHSVRLKLLFLGRIGKYKGIEMLMEALNQAEDDIWDCLTIAGKPLYPLAIPDNKKITLIDKWLSQSEMAELLHEHDVLVLPYKSATQSGIITLGISAAIPMICTRVGGLVEQLSGNETIWVEPDAKSLLKGIQFLSKNPAVYSAIHLKLQEKMKQFNWEKPAGHATLLLNKYTDPSSVVTTS